MNFLIDLASHPSFQSGDVHTGFIDQHFDSLFPPQTIDDQVVVQAIAALVTNEKNAEHRNSVRRNGVAPITADLFAAGDSFRVNGDAVRVIRLQNNGKGASQFDCINNSLSFIPTICSLLRSIETNEKRRLQSTNRRWQMERFDNSITSRCMQSTIHSQMQSEWRHFNIQRGHHIR